MSASDSTKRCTKCDAVRPLTEFHRKPTYTGGYHTWCKFCVSAYNKAYKAKNRERLMAADRARYWANKEEYSEKAKRRYRENPESAKRRAKERRATYPERLADEQRRYRERNQDKRRLARARRRAAKKNGDAPGRPRREHRVLWQMYDSQGGLCAYCEEPLFGNFHLEHMIPLSRGGAHDWMNLALACPTCNMRKGERTVEEFMERLALRAFLGT